MRLSACGAGPSAGQRGRGHQHPGQPMASSPSPWGCGHGYQVGCSCAEGALSRQPPGRAFWSGGHSPQAPWQERAPGTRREATALTAWLRGSAKDRHCLSVGPHSPHPPRLGVALLPDSPQGPRREETKGTSVSQMLTRTRAHFPQGSSVRLSVYEWGILSPVRLVICHSYTARKWQSQE